MSLPDSKHNKSCVYIPARWHGGFRKLDERLIVIHDTESGPTSARGVANYFAHLPYTKKVSSHKIVDRNECITAVKDPFVAWAAPGSNSDGLQLEICGYARWSKRTWFVNQATLKRAAWVVAKWCIKYHIPAKWLTPAQIRAGAYGVTTHADVNKAYGMSSHTDPGPNFPRVYFLFLVRRRMRWLST